MRAVLVAGGVVMALGVAAVASLNCTQCSSFANSCDNTSVSECPFNASTSCVTSWANSSLGGSMTLYQSMFCSADNCSGGADAFLAFAVHVSDGERFRFASQCCQGRACNDTGGPQAPPPGDASNSTECPACHGPNATSCVERPRRCHKGEQCVSLDAEFLDSAEPLVLKGCSDIRSSTCQQLSAGNQVVGGVLFRKVECRESSVDSTPTPATNSGTSSVTTPASNSGTSSVTTPASNSGTSSVTTPASNSGTSSVTTPASNSGTSSVTSPASPVGSGTGSRASPTSLGLASLLLLGLLL